MMLVLELSLSHILHGYHWSNPKEYPELFIKNTILREVTRANEVVALAGRFHYVNLDRDLMRDQDNSKKLKEQKNIAREKVNQ